MSTITSGAAKSMNPRSTPGEPKGDQRGEPKGDQRGEPKGVSPRSTPDATPSVRDANGRFAKGNPGGPGNPFARQMAALRQALVDAVRPEDIQAIARTLLEKAKAGNEPAAKLLFQYVLGKPGPAPNPDRLDLEEWQVFLEHEPVAYGLNKAALSADPDLYLNVVRAIKPEATRIIGNEIVEALLDPKGWSQKHAGEQWQLVAERKKKAPHGAAENAQTTPRETAANGAGGAARGSHGPTAQREDRDDRLGDVASISVCGAHDKAAKNKRRSATAQNGAGAREVGPNKRSVLDLLERAQRNGVH